jgi:hypothetical protein
MIHGTHLKNTLPLENDLHKFSCILLHCVSPSQLYSKRGGGFPIIPGEKHICTLCATIYLDMKPVAGVLDESYSANPPQRSSHTSPPVYIGWTRFQPM